MIRQAVIEDIPEIQIVRHSVRENRLSDPWLVTDASVEDYISRRGRGWVFEAEGILVGFAIVDLHDHCVWALFVRPAFEQQGVGSQLHDQLLLWYFSQSHEVLWLSTGPATRAYYFYLKKGWKEVGIYGKGEAKFEMNYRDWSDRNHGICCSH